MSTRRPPNPSEPLGRRPRASMADVAALAGVSQQTVSRVVRGQANVSEKTRRRVSDAIEQLGFRPNYAGRSLREGVYHTVGVCTFDISLAGNQSLFNGVVLAARERGYAVTVVDMGPEDEVPYSVARATRRLAELPVDGAIINLNILPQDFEAYTPLPGMETVLVSMYAHPRCATVDSDHYGSAVMAVRHLLGLGHTQVRHVAGPAYHTHAEFREAGWRDELFARSLPAVEPLRGDWSVASGYEAGLVLARDKAMTAVFVANDQMAAGVIAALRSQGRRVPEDVSVVGVDDSLGDYAAENELTTVRFDDGRRGCVAFERAIDGGEPQAIRIPGELVVRASTAPCAIRD